MSGHPMRRRDDGPVEGSTLHLEVDPFALVMLARAGLRDLDRRSLGQTPTLEEQVRQLAGALLVTGPGRFERVELRMAPGVIPDAELVERKLAA